MPDTTSASLQIVNQEEGGNPDTWGPIADTNFTRLEEAVANITTKAVTGGSDTLTAAERRKSILIFTGTLTSNETVIVEAAEKRWFVRNSTSGAHTLTVKTAAGTGVAVAQGEWKHLYCDGTNVEEVAVTAAFPINDANALVQDPVDNTKQVRIDAGAVGTGQTRVLSMPDRDVDLDNLGNTELAQMAQATIKGRARGAGTGDPVDLSAAQARTILNVEDGATADQTDAEIKTAYENNANTNAFTDAEQTKLSGIEASADVTDATNVAAAGAVMNSDISESEGFVRKTGAGAYEAIKSNLNASVAPAVGDDSNDGYAVGSEWINTTADKAFICLDASVGAAVWTETTAGAAGGISNVVDDTTPQLGGQLDVNGQALGDGTLELLTFSETASAVNHLNVTNATTTNGPTLSAVGDDTNVDLNLAGKGSGRVKIGGNNVLTTADEGAGNGLDADTLDGQQGSVYRTESFIVAASDETSNLTTGTGKVTFRMPYVFTLTDVRANVNKAPAGSVITVDINKNGATILSTKLTIDATEKTSKTAAVAAVISDTALADDAEITIDIDTVGSTTSGKGLKVALIGTRNT